MRRRRRSANLAGLLLQRGTAYAFGDRASAGTACPVALGHPPPAGTVPPEDAEFGTMYCDRHWTAIEIPAGRDWLDCFYAAPEPVRVRLGLASQFKPPVKREATTPASQFGLTSKTLRGPDAISARMASYEFNKNHLFTVTLDNGQVWQQIEGDDLLANWSRSPRNYSVVITRGLFGSYNFRVLKNGGLFRVRRVR